MNYIQVFAEETDFSFHLFIHQNSAIARGKSYVQFNFRRAHHCDYFALGLIAFRKSIDLGAERNQAGNIIGAMIAAAKDPRVNS